MSSAARVALACAALAVAVSVVAVVASISVQSWRLSVLVRMSSAEPLAALARSTDASFAFVQPSAHYDGVYFYAIARDPLAWGPEHGLIDQAAYRYGHAAYGWLAWLVSAGQPSAVPAALLALGLSGIAVAAAATSLISREIGWSPWAGLAVAVNPGLIYAATVLTSETVGAAVLSLALLAWLRHRLSWAGILLVLLCLTKEQFVLVPLGLAVWEGIEWARGCRPPDPGRRALALAAGPAAFALWLVYVRVQIGAWPIATAEQALGIPPAGWLETFAFAAAMGTDGFYQMQLGQAEVPLLTVLAAALALGIARATRFRTPLDPVYILLAVLIFSLNWLSLLYPKELIRATAVVLILLPVVLATPRAGWTPHVSDPAP